MRFKAKNTTIKFYDPITEKLVLHDPATGKFYPLIADVAREVKRRGVNFDTFTAWIAYCETQENVERFLAWLRSHPDAERDEIFDVVMEQFNAGHMEKYDVWVSENHPRPSSL